MFPHYVRRSSRQPHASDQPAGPRPYYRPTELYEETGVGFVTGKDFIETSAARHPLSLEQTLYSAVTAALCENDIVYVDDVDLIHDATSS